METGKKNDKRELRTVKDVPDSWDLLKIMLIKAQLECIPQVKKEKSKVQKANIPINATRGENNNLHLWFDFAALILKLAFNKEGRHPDLAMSSGTCFPMPFTAL